MNFGLSADTDYADRIRELASKRFLTNSDAHSLPKIAREYNTFEMENISFESFKKDDNKKLNYIVCNNGMYPKLGKYNKTYCDMCKCVSEIEDGKCKKCGSKKIVKGVEDRIFEIADRRKYIT